MNQKDMAALAKSWIELQYCEHGSEGYDEKFWAYDAISDLCSEDPHTCWEVVQLIGRLDSSDVILSNLAAGPLEDLLCYHGDSVIDGIEQVAKMDDQIKKVLGAVWENNIPPHIWSRVKGVAGNSW